MFNSFFIVQIYFRIELRDAPVTRLYFSSNTTNTTCDDDGDEYDDDDSILFLVLKLLLILSLRKGTHFG